MTPIIKVGTETFLNSHNAKHEIRESTIMSYTKNNWIVQRCTQYQVQRIHHKSSQHSPQIEVVPDAAATQGRMQMHLLGILGSSLILFSLAEARVSVWPVLVHVSLCPCSLFLLVLLLLLVACRLWTCLCTPCVVAVVSSMDGCGFVKSL